MADASQVSLDSEVMKYFRKMHRNLSSNAREEERNLLITSTAVSGLTYLQFASEFTRAVL